MTGTVRVWLVERTYTDKGMVTLVYARPDGGGYLRRQLSEHMLGRTDVTAAMDVDPERLQPVREASERERYATEATRVAETHDHDEAI
jgi:hypothetical protein